MAAQKYNEDLYINALINLAKRIQNNEVKQDKLSDYKSIIYTTKALAAGVFKNGIGSYSDESINSIYDMTRGLIIKMAKLTPGEFIRLFPIIKEYGGKRYEMKDYFSTMEYIKTLDPDKPIGEKEIDNFLREYHNNTVCFFVVERLSLIDEMRRREGDPSMAEEYFSALGVPIYKEGKVGNHSFLLNTETEKTSKLIKRPSFLKVLPGGKFSN